MSDQEVMQIVNFLVCDHKFIIYLLGCSLAASLIVHLIEEFSYWLVDTFTSLLSALSKK